MDGSPQVEEGYTRIANELLQALSAVRFAGQEYQIILAVARLTYGFQKKADSISHGQISKMIGIPRVKVARLVSTLISKKVLGVTNNGDRKPLTLWINKHYDEWKPVPKKGDIPKNGDKSIPDNGDKPIPQNGTLQRNKKKKDIPVSNSSKTGTPSPLVPEESPQELLARYSASEQESIREVFKALAATRASGRIRESVLLGELRYWSSFEAWKVIGGIRKYIAGEYHLDGKREEYLRGIVRNFKSTERGNGHSQQRTGSLLDTINLEEVHAVD